MSRVGTLQQHWRSLAVSIRQFLCWTFALTAFFAGKVSLSTALSTLPLLLHHPHPIPGIKWKITALAFGLSLPAQSVVFAIAWWTVWRRKPSARVWAIIASVTFILLSCSMLYGVSEVWREEVLWYVALPLFSVGVLGLIVFSPRTLTEETSIEESIPGDGTNPVLDTLIWIFGIAGYFAGYYWWWMRWADAKALPIFQGLPYYLEILVASLVVALVHELGHSIVGKALGMRLRVFAVGPFHWYLHEGTWKFQFYPANIIAVGGATSVVPTTLEHFLPNQICMIAAGPLASLLGGLLAFCGALTASNSSWEQAWQLLAIIATLSLLASILNLIPFKTGASYSDGAQIYQLLSKGPWSDYHRATSVVHSAIVTPLRLRDIDVEALKRASSSITRGQRGLLLRLYAYEYHFDSGNLSDASEALAKAEAIYEESASDISAHLHTVFVFGTAYLRRDAAAAHLWWERMQSKKPDHFNVDYWLAYSALCWIENRLDEAEKAWQKCYALAQQLPITGAYEFDRYRVSLLRNALDESLTRLDQEQPATIK